MKKKRQITIYLYDIVYDRGFIDDHFETRSFTKKELANFKRSNRKKSVVTMTKLSEITVIIKHKK